jgi:DNA-binding NarL/FixJ family response regulator
MLSEVTEGGSADEFRSALLGQIGAFSGAEVATLSARQCPFVGMLASINGAYANSPEQQILEAAKAQLLRTAWGYDASQKKTLVGFHQNMKRYASDMIPVVKVVGRDGYCLTRQVYSQRDAERLPFFNEVLYAIGSKDELAMSIVWRGTPLAFVTGSRHSNQFNEIACKRARALAQLAAPLLVAVEAIGTKGISVPGWASLSKREREIVEYVRTGLTNNEIGTVLRVSFLTVRNHVASILRKLHVSNRTELAGLVAMSSKDSYIH